ncbi:hypothetical protein SCP_1101430 [Sparassis crispa]|uniref:Uncharacterized protein n=1 Tax=Sparassis crispa TaxID=139825 RepID=A0A401GZ76_9APHY|nr:hypothetical protein SCP_1101430 [Sparassis crispa]GBE87467.1 hypothetical protein SCP_1101430 [Sparassis crispa]
MHSCSSAPRMPIRVWAHIPSLGTINTQRGGVRSPETVGDIMNRPFVWIPEIQSPFLVALLLGEGDVTQPRLFIHPEVSSTAMHTHLVAQLSLHASHLSSSPSPPQWHQAICEPVSASANFQSVRRG